MSFIGALSLIVFSSYITYVHDYILLCIIISSHHMSIHHTKYLVLFYSISYHLFASVSLLKIKNVEHNLLEKERLQSLKVHLKVQIL